MSNKNRNHNQNQNVVDVAPDELKPVNNSKPEEKKKMGFGEWLTGWPGRHPKATKVGKAVLQGVGTAAAVLGGGYVGAKLATRDTLIDLDNEFSKYRFERPSDTIREIETAPDDVEVENDTTTYD